MLMPRALSAAWSLPSCFRYGRMARGWRAPHLMIIRFNDDRESHSGIVQLNLDECCAIGFHRHRALISEIA